MTKAVRLEYDGPIAVITNDNVEKHNAFDDDMDLQLFAALGRAEGSPRRACGHLARRGQVVLVRDATCRPSAVATSSSRTTSS